MKKNEQKEKSSKKAELFEWLKLLALVLIVVPPFEWIFTGFNPYGFIIIGVGVLLFCFNMLIIYLQDKKAKNNEKSQHKKNDKN